MEHEEQVQPTEGTPVGAESSEAPTPETPQEETPTPETPQEEAPPPKPYTDPVHPVNDEELDTLEEEGAADVNEMSPQEANADNSVDNQENDIPPPASPSE